MAGFGEKLLAMIGLEKADAVEDERMAFGYNKGGRKRERAERINIYEPRNDRGYDDDEYIPYDDEYDDEPDFGRNTGRISGIPATSKVRMLIYKPVSYDDSQVIIDNLKDKKSLIVNLDELDTDVAQRILDFISGAVYALSGNIKKAARNIFVVAPYNVDVDTNMTDGMSREDDFDYNYFDRE